MAWDPPHPYGAMFDHAVVKTECWWQTMDGIFTPGNIIVFVIVVVALVVGGRRALQGLTKGKSCCTDGESTAPRAATERAVAVDTDESHYPYRTELLIGGMSCENCARRVERALNAIPGTLAHVDLDAHTASVLTKDPVDRAACETAVRDAGYYVMKL